MGRLEGFVLQKNNLFWLFSLLYLFLIVILIPVAVASLTPAVRNLAFFHSILERFGALMLWFVFVLVVFWIILRIHFKDEIVARQVFRTGKIALWIVPFIAIYIYSLQIADAYSFRNPYQHFELPLVILGVYFLIWGALNEFTRKNIKLSEKINYAFLVFGVFSLPLSFTSIMRISWTG